MDIQRLDHVNLRTTRLDEMIEWYTTILDMPPGDRPPFSFPGAWCYRHGHALVHLVGVGHEGSTENLKLEHFALSATGLKKFLAHLEKHNVRTRVGRLPGFRDAFTETRLRPPERRSAGPCSAENRSPGRLR